MLSTIDQDFAILLRRSEPHLTLPARGRYGEGTFRVEGVSTTRTKDLTVSDFKSEPFWKRRYTLAPGMAALLGVLAGWALAIVSAFPSFRGLSFFLTFWGLFGGAMGYTCWLSFDPARSKRLFRMHGLVSTVTILGLVIAFPEFCRSIGTLFFVILWGGICAAVLFLAGGAMGMAHLIGYLASSFRGPTKPVADSPTAGVWDHELDDA